MEGTVKQCLRQSGYRTMGYDEHTYVDGFVFYTTHYDTHKRLKRGKGKWFIENHDFDFLRRIGTHVRGND